MNTPVTSRKTAKRIRRTGRSSGATPKPVARSPSQRFTTRHVARAVISATT
jgi:hypothetical protein